MAIFGETRLAKSIPYTPLKSARPQTVVHAAHALWIWTAWTCIVGLYLSWRSIPELEGMITEQLQGMISIAPATMMQAMLGGYALMGILSAWMIWEIGRGKKWARASVMLGFVCQIIGMAVPPYHQGVALIADIPDFGLQLYAIYLMYTPPARGWFNPKIKDPTPIPDRSLPL
jgi:hypothetical protein